jgi:hypothetical protein
MLQPLLGAAKNQHSFVLNGFVKNHLPAHRIMARRWPVSKAAAGQHSSPSWPRLRPKNVTNPQQNHAFFSVPSHRQQLSY